MQKPKPIDFERLVLLHNPRSSNADKTEKISTALEKAYPGKITKKSLGATDKENIVLLKALLRPGDILLICGGDGTISRIVDCLLSRNVPAALQRTPILPVGTGRMNDVAKMLNGRYASNPLYVLRHGHQLPIYPLECVCTPLDNLREPITKRVIHNIGFGYSGQCSVIWNDPEFRASIQKGTAVSRTVKFFKAGANALRDAPYFDISIDGKRHPVLDVEAAVGHINGGYYRLPNRLSSRNFLFFTADDKSFLGTTRTVAELVTNRFSGGQTTTSARFILHDQILANLGGEPFTPPAPCEVSIKTRSKPVIMLATNPEA